MTHDDHDELSQVEAGQESPKAKPQRRHFRRSDGPKLSPEAAARQGRVTTLAFEKLGKDEAIAYLNLASTHLGGRPLDLATASVEGLKRIEHDLAGPRPVNVVENGG